MRLSHLVAGFAVLATALYSAEQAQAFWGHGSHGSHGSRGSHGSWGSRGSHGSWGSRGSHGSHGSRGWYSSGGSRGWYSSGGSSGGSSGWYSSGGSSGGTIKGHDNGKPAAAPDAPPASDDKPAAPAPDAGARVAVPTDGVAITVNLPASAKVFINDRATTSEGARRWFVSRGLRPGATYRYVVRAEMTRDGKTINKEETVRLRAGEQANLDFDMREEVAAQPEENKVTAVPAETTLVVNVPADAKVFLSGNATKATGKVRQYVTGQLAQGETWDDYLVRAEVTRDGRTISRVQRISITGGDTRDLTFDFNAPAVASR